MMKNTPRPTPTATRSDLTSDRLWEDVTRTKAEYEAALAAYLAHHNLATDAA